MRSTKITSPRTIGVGLLALVAMVPLMYAQRTQSRAAAPARGEAPRASAPQRAPEVSRVNHGSFGHVENPVPRPPAPSHITERHYGDVQVHRDVNVDFHRHQFWHDFHFGSRFHDLPLGYFALMVGGAPYFYDDGIYYEQIGDGYQEVYPPIGAAVTQPPDGAIAIVAGGLTYYYAGGAFYVEQDGGYVVAPTPIGVTVPDLPPGAVQVSLNGGIAFQFNGTYYQPVFVDGVTQYVTIALPN